MNRLFWAVILATAVLAGCTSQREREELEAKRVRRVEAHVNLGAEYLMRNQLDVAQQELERALEIDPDNSQANHLMGLLQIRLKDDKEAERHFRRAISTDDKNSDARNSYGVFLCEHGRFDEADAEYRAALGNPLYKVPAQANTNAGICRMKKNDRRGAAEYFRAALKSDSRQSAALVNLARLSFEDGELLAARGFMQRYLEVGGDSPDILLLAFRIERALGSQDRQASFAVRLREKYPNSNEARMLRSLIGK